MHYSICTRYIEHGEWTVTISEDSSAMRGRDGERGRAGWAACRRETLCRRARGPTARASRAPARATVQAAAAPDLTRPHSRLPAARAPSATACAGTGSRARTHSGTRGRTSGKTDDASPGVLL